MNSIELKAQRYFNWEDDKINTISILGNTETLINIKEILVNSGHANQLILTEMETVKKQMDDINKQVVGMNEEEKSAYVTNLYTEKVKTELAKQGITGDINEYMKQEYQKAPEYQKEMIQNVLEEHEIESAETEVSKIGDQLLNGIKSKANNGWCGFRVNGFFGGFSISDCKDSWSLLNYIGTGATIFSLIINVTCIANFANCTAIKVYWFLISYYLKTIAKSGKEVANVCGSGRSKIIISVWPIKAREPNCD